METRCQRVHEVGEEGYGIAVGNVDRMKTMRCKQTRGAYWTNGGNQEISENVSLRSPYVSPPPTTSLVLFL